MSKVGIITDSIHGLSPELIKQHDIRIAPMGVNIGSKGYRDGIDITAAQFYPLFKEAKTPSTTNAASPGDFLAAYTSLAQKTDSMVYIGVSAALTATFKVAQQTRQMFLKGHPESRSNWSTVRIAWAPWVSCVWKPPGQPKPARDYRKFWIWFTI